MYVYAYVLFEACNLCVQHTCYVHIFHRSHDQFVYIVFGYFFFVSRLFVLPKCFPLTTYTLYFKGAIFCCFILTQHLYKRTHTQIPILMLILTYTKQKNEQRKTQRSRAHELLGNWFILLHDNGFCCCCCFNFWFTAHLLLLFGCLLAYFFPSHGIYVLLKKPVCCS